MEGRDGALVDDRVDDALSVWGVDGLVFTATDEELSGGEGAEFV